MSQAHIKSLMEEANQAYQQAQAVLKEFDGKPLPEDKGKQVDQWLDEVEAKKDEATRLRRAMEADAYLNDPATGLPAPAGGLGGGSAQEDKSGGWEGASAASDHPALAYKRRYDHILRAKLSPEQKAVTQAFGRYLKQGRDGVTSAEYKALSAGDDAAGGFLVPPVQFAAGILKFVDDLVAVRQLATVETLTQAESLGIISLDADLADWDWTTELATGAEDTVEPFGQRALTPHPTAKRIKISETLIRKASRPVESLVQERIAYKLGVTQEKAYLTGSGAQRPLGMFVASADGIPTSRDVAYTDTNDTTRSDSLINLKQSLKQQYQDSPTTRWIFHRDMVTRIRKYRDANGMFLWNPGLALTSGTPKQVLDIPYIQSEFAPNTFTSTNYIAVLGDLKHYWIVDALQMQIQTLLELYAETNQRGYTARYEGDGAPVLAEAFARLQFA